jgi:Domain of unknown function (DUF4832)/Domain of unknown function (DUF4874)
MLMGPIPIEHACARTEVRAGRPIRRRVRSDRSRRRRLAVVSLGAVVTVTGVLAATPAVATTAGTTAAAATTSSRTYSPSSADIANPDRGMYHYTETRFRADGSGATPLDLATLTRWRTTENITLVYRIFYLEKYADRDGIDAADLQSIATDFATARTAGVKLVVRFAYSESSSRDAPLPRVLGQLRLLAPVLNASADTISALQAGFIGRWGEWYYTDNFASDPSRPWVLTAADWAARRTFLDNLLALTSPGIFVQVRYPGIKQTLTPPTDSRAARVGIHNDCFLASADDYGTFANDGDRTWLADQTRTTPMGGETCQTNAPRSQWPTAAAELAAYHWTYLNADYERGVLDSWGTGLAQAKQRLGYRLRLVGSTVSLSAQTNAPLAVNLTVANDGFAAPLRNRPVQLVLRSTTRTYAVPLTVDVRTLLPGRTTSLALSVPAPAVAGTYSLSLALPDPSARLASQSAYSVQLANTGTWVAGTGQNDLQLSVRVDGTPGCG